MKTNIRKLPGIKLGLLFFLAALAPLSSPGFTYPLEVGPTGRYLVDQGGAPFLIQGDAVWSLISALNSAELGTYLQDRGAKGFNALIVSLIDKTSYPRVGNPYISPINAYGQGPFLTAGDFSTPNEAYFTNADWVIDQAAARGMVVVLFPCYVGYPGTTEGWYNEMIANGTNKCRQYGQYVGNRYKNKPNIIWAMYADYNPDATIKPLVDAMVAGMQSADTNHLFTVHLQRGYDVRSLLAGTTWLQLDTSYTDLQTYVGCLQAYGESPAMPVFQIENYYEGEHSTTAANVRAEAYWANLSGACGQTFGNLPVWGFTTGWEGALNSQGANDMTRVQALFLSRPWTSLVPDGSHTVVTAGYGSGLSYVAAARTSDGGTAMAYLPAGGTVTVDMTKISGTQAQGWWYNPQTGGATNLGLFATSGSGNFTAPDGNDWVLVLDDASRKFSAPGLNRPRLSITATGPNTFQITFNGGPGQSFTVQASSGFSSPWQSIGTSTTDASGMGVYNVTNSATSGSFRVAQFAVSGLTSSRLSIASLGPKAFRLSFRGNPGVSYSMQHTPILNNVSWRTVGTVIADDFGNASYIVSGVLPSGYWRVTYP